MMEDYNKYSFDSDYARESRGLTLSSYVSRTFLWMFAGLLVTFLTGYLGAVTGVILYVFTIPYMYIVLLVAELVVVMVLSARVQSLSVGAARALFFAYAVLNGIVFSTYFLIFEMGTLMLVFAMTALYFGVFALYGHFTKHDLSGMRPFIIGGLIFLIVMGVISMFIPMGGVERLICLGGIALFLCITAYDTQRIKSYYAYYGGDAEMLQKASIYAALQLYLDFINLFLYLLRFVNRNRN